MRRWLALLVAATTSLVLIALLVPMALLVRAVAENGAMGRATTTAESVALSPDPELSAQRASLPVEVIRRVTPQSSDAVRLAALGRSVTAEADDGRQVLTSVQSPRGTVVISVFVSERELRRGVYEAWLALLVLGLALVVLGIVLADRLARRLVEPIGELAGVSHRLAGGDLEARARPGGPPELRSVALALNHLAGRIGDLLAAERESVADLSHRLRTPLTGLRLDAEALRDREEAARIAARVDDLERAVSSIINDARHHERAQTSCDAAAVVGDRVRFWSVLAEDQEREVTVELPEGRVQVAVAAADLAAAVDALLGNVFAHTPEGTAFSVRLTPDGRLSVHDEGPGFDAALLERGSSGAGSTGLGLDIVRRTAEASGGSMRLSKQGVELLLGR
ncbi:MAG: HAMP domain-containing histidine kinase [Thermoactinospora sp.]|nr:HAMP domain-containing histidine kinase [Thermoactinospora sp.]